MNLLLLFSLLSMRKIVITPLRAVFSGCVWLAIFGWMAAFAFADEQTAWQSDPYWQERLRVWQQRLQAETVKQQETDLLDELAQMDRQRLAYDEQFQALLGQEKKLITEVASAKQHAQLQHEIHLAMLRRMKPRLRLFYRVIRLGHARLLVNTRSLKEMALRWSALRLLTLSDIKMLREYQILRQIADDASARLLAKQKALTALKKQLKRQHRLLTYARREKALALQMLYRRARLVRRLARALKGSKLALQRMLESDPALHASTLPVRRQTTTRARMPWPIQSFTPYCVRYRLAKQGSFVALVCEQMSRTRLSLRTPLGRTGIVLHVPEGTPVLAVAHGKAVYTGWLRGYGQLLILDHGNRFHTLYAHLSRFHVRQGDVVHIGQIIGASGSSGSLEPPSLYFEIRHIARSLPPERWLTPISPPAP